MASTLKDILRRFLPASVLVAYRKRLLARDRKANSRLSSAQVFENTYAKNRWGGQKGEFCSGSGSRGRVVTEYVQMVQAFMNAEHLTSIVDLGCGDFYVGHALVVPGVTYAGIDVVPALIRRNQQLYASSAIRFACLDICTDTLPNGELCLIRQVLQHLSNDQVRAVLSKVRRYKFTIVTEHYPSPSKALQRNLDKPPGADTRIVNGSGLFIDEAPFNRRVERVIQDTPVEHWLVERGETLRSLLLLPD